MKFSSSITLLQNCFLINYCLINLKVFSASEESLNNPLCGKQFFRPVIASYSDLNIRIVGGVDALKAEFPWTASLQKESRGKFIHFCGGAVISDYFIITAAHCADIFVGIEDKLRVRLGTNNIKNPDEGVYMKVSEIFVHEQWDRDNNLNDIALYKLERPIKYSIDRESGRYLVNSVCLPSKTDTDPDWALVVGWGQLDSSNAETTPNLQKALVPKFPIKRCQINYQHLGTVTRNMFCYGGEGDLDSCLGDSGGPLITKKDKQYSLVGIVSYGVPCALKNYPTIYTKTSRYIDWIYKNIKIRSK